jgi:hypothetical protein
VALPRSGDQSIMLPERQRDRLRRITVEYDPHELLACHCMIRGLEMSNNIIQKGLDFLGEESVTLRA